MMTRQGKSGHVRLSVIVPGYNTSEEQWTRCICSLIAATREEDEIILVDDGSRDGARFLDSFGCRVIHKPNGGLGSARNCGIEVARGDFITFVDSDDEVTQDVYELALAEMRKMRSDVCLFGVKTLWTDIGLSKTDVPETKCYGTLKPQDVVTLSRKCLLNYAWNKVYRNGFLARHRLRFELEGVPCEDIIFNLQVAMCGAVWCSVNCVGSLYYRTDGTLLSSYKKTMSRGLRLCREAWRRYRDLNGDSSAELDSHVFTDARVAYYEWDNLWRKGAPCGLSVRWAFLQQNARFFHGFLPFHFLKQMCHTVIRRHFYFRWIRKRMIRRLYPYATEIPVRKIP